MKLASIQYRGRDMVAAEIAPGELVGISAHTETYPNALRIAARVKELSPGTSVVLGGPHPSILPEGVLADGLAVAHHRDAVGKLCNGAGRPIQRHRELRTAWLCRVWR